MPMTAHAGTGSAMQMGTEGITSGDILYFGYYGIGQTYYHVPWIVLDSDMLSGTSVATGTKVIPLLSKYTIGASVFQSSGNGYYPNSTLNTAMRGLYSSLFYDNDERAVADTTLKGYSMSDGQSDLTEQKFFPMSSIEGSSDILQTKSITNAGGADVNWWLRSSNGQSFALLVTSSGNYDFNSVTDSLGVRPACNLNLSAVLFSSNVGGKSNVADGTMTAISSTTPSEWELTLDDSAARNTFTVTETTMTAKRGDTKNITYTGATTGANEYVSAMITNTSGTDILYYGKLELATSGDNQEANITIPSSLAEGNYTLKIFNEQCSSFDQKSDLSSAFKNITLTVTESLAPSPNPAPTSSANTTCDHDYEFIEITSGTTYADGEYGLICKKCGHVKEDSIVTISAYTYMQKEAFDKIMNAPKDGEVVIDTAYWTSFTSMLKEAMKQRPDVTITINYTYNHVNYTVTIPKGTDNEAIFDKNGYCGFRNLDQMFAGKERK